MAAPYSMDLRERALARKAAGETNREIAAGLHISPSCVSKWTKRERETGSVAPAQMGGHKPRTLSGDTADWLRARIGSGRFTLRGLAAELAERGIKTDPRAVWVFLHAEGLSFKKTLLPEEQTRPDVARKRDRWKAYQSRIALERLVFIDETWVKTNMAPLRGWGPRGRRLKAYAPFGHWKTQTFIAALRHDRIDAPWVIDGPINGKLFTVYVEEILAPTLSPGDVVVLDNLGSHKGKAARAAVRARGAHLLFLPPYSPDLNPIEQVFAKLKHGMRQTQPRNIEATWRKVGDLIEAFTPKECANYLRNSGYGSI
ncbi:MAG: IS630 family transposase [Phenylobacterium sp.]|uniref:IS630 family transposase n=1 Tax=Phenylobacterium sp. TaxID=1871053 RepID=UPI0025D75938|nr:IS630 family transposase [Phenylobacterium sp.]MCA6227496.1 IS630 family transposase [Phenylobacterium sp.]MCA6250371.1 IS630 family transposase [Phenylobacterium sp.]MCA6252805.1 IS630 family transposase [Phenylobacterium sp.]MCA6266604.1 IS630 family transposase [Phenylobacterium sp.]MCA6269022.1 IS630 family transposase [Phenylobacterium sp.]